MSGSTAAFIADLSAARRFGPKSRRSLSCSPSGGKRKADAVGSRNVDLNGLLRSLAGMPGARAETHESVRFEVDGINEAMENIKRLQGTGALTIHFHDGKPNGLAEWKTSQRTKG